MIDFPSQDAVEVSVTHDGFILFHSFGELQGTEEQFVLLSIGQFRSVIKHAEELIAQADANKRNAEAK
jgi:hypothetical protein